MARRMSSFFSKKKSTDADQPPPPATNDDADQRVVAEDAEVAEAEPVSELAAREDAKSRKRALVFIAVFWMDNIFTAFVADAMAEVFPFTYKRGKWTAATILALIGYDVFNTAFSAVLVFGAMRYLSSHLKVQTKESEALGAFVDVETEKGTEGYEKVRTRDICARFVMYAASFTMAVANKTVAYYCWYGIEAIFTDKHTEIGACSDTYADIEVTYSIGFAMLITTLFTLISIYWSGRAAAAVSTTWRFVFQMIAESFAIAIGWTLFNMVEITIKCQASWLYDSTLGMVVEAAVVTFAGFFAFKFFINYDEGAVSAENEGLKDKFWHRLYHFGLSAVLVVVSLSIVTSFYTPLSEVSSLSSYDIGYIMLAIGMAFSGVVSYWGVQNKWNFEKSANRVVHNYLFSVAGWVSCYTFWYGFDKFVYSWDQTDGSTDTVKSLFVLGVTISLFGLLTRVLIALLDDYEDGEGGDDGGETEPLREPGAEEGGAVTPRGRRSSEAEQLMKKSYLMRCIAEENHS